MKKYAMKNVSLKLLFLASAGAFFAFSSSASADLLYDCSLVGKDATTAMNNLKLTTKNPLNKDDLNISMENLKAYCCQINVSTESCEAAKENTSNPESPYIFDQMISRGFFKLDNKIDGSKDSKGDERAKKVKEWTDSGKGKLPVSIQNTFVQMWQPAKRYEPNINQSTCDIENYDNLDLAARYTAVCKQAACITKKFTIAVSDLNPRYDETNCEAMAKKRIEDEMTYIQTLMVRKSNTLMKDMRQSYTQSYMLETRRTTLIGKFSKVNETFSSVNGKVQEGTRVCSAAGGK